MLDEVDPWLRKKCLRILCRVCGQHALLPRSVQISLRYNRINAPRYNGGFAEVWKTEHGGRNVAVKVLKVYATSDLVRITRVGSPVFQRACVGQLTPTIQRFCKEVLAWKSLRHQNVLSLLGVMMVENQLTMISEWMVNGNINEFIRANRDANRFGLVRFIPSVGRWPRR